MVFDIARPIPKDEFLLVYKDSVLLTQLVFAPFGVSNEVIDLLGDKSSFDLYTSMFQQWEDIISKKVFSSKGYDDDRIIASMHKFISKGHDKEIISEVRIASEALANLLKDPEVVEYDAIEAFLVNPVTTARLLANVFNALDLLYKSNVTYGNDSSLDKIIYDAFGIKVCSRPFYPFLHFSFKNKSKSFDNSILDVLTNCLTITDNSGSVVRFTLHQYYALLDVYGGSDEVKEVIQTYSQAMAKDNENENNKCILAQEINDNNNIALSIESLRNGYSPIGWKYNFSMNPLASYISQVVHLLPKVKYNHKKSNSSDKKKTTEDTNATKKSKSKKNKSNKIDDNHSNDDKEDEDDEEDEEDGGEWEDCDSDEEEEDDDNEDEDEDVWEDCDDDDEVNDNDNDENDDENQPAGTTSEQEKVEVVVHSEEYNKMAEKMRLSLNWTWKCLNAIQNAMTTAVDGDFDSDIEDLSKVIDKLSSSSKDNNSDDEIIVPTYIRAQIYFARASFYAEQGEITQALNDVNVILLLDPAHAEGYSLRSQLLAAKHENEMLTHGDSQDEEDDREQNYDFYCEMKGKAKIVNKEKSENLQNENINNVKTQAAEDALTAFLLGDSVDLELAASAEETARESCRLSAKEIFYQRHQMKQQQQSQQASSVDSSSSSINNVKQQGNSSSNDQVPVNVHDNMPRSWLVASYFNGYGLLSHELDLYLMDERYRSDLLVDCRKVIVDDKDIQPKTRGQRSLNDICDDEDDNNEDDDSDNNNNQLFKKVKFHVPSQLLNTKLYSASGGIDDDVIDSNKLRREVEEEEHDLNAYEVLLSIATLLEDVTYESRRAIEKPTMDQISIQYDEKEEEKDEKIQRSIATINVATANIQVNNSSDVMAIIDSLLSSSNIVSNHEEYTLIDHGVCQCINGYDEQQQQQEQLPNVEISAEIEPFIPKAEQIVAKTKLGNINIESTNNKTSNNKNKNKKQDSKLNDYKYENLNEFTPPCKYFQQILHILRTPEVEQYSEVIFHENGTIKSINTPQEILNKSLIDEKKKDTIMNLDVFALDPTEDKKLPKPPKENKKKKNKKNNNKKKNSSGLHDTDDLLQKQLQEQYDQYMEEQHDAYMNEYFDQYLEETMGNFEYPMGEDDYYDDDEEEEENYDDYDNDNDDVDSKDWADYEDEDADNGEPAVKSEKYHKGTGKHHDKKNKNIQTTKKDDEEDDNDDEGDWEDCDDEDDEEDDENGSKQQHQNKSSVTSKQENSANTKVDLNHDTSFTVGINSDIQKKSSKDTNGYNDDNNTAIDSTFFDNSNHDKDEDNNNGKEKDVFARVEDTIAQTLDKIAELTLGASNNDDNDDISHEDDKNELDSSNIGESKFVVELNASDKVPMVANTPPISFEELIAKEKAEKEEIYKASSCIISRKLRARYQNICGSLAYLAGDAIGALQCFRSSLYWDPELLDSQVKLGALLIDMDEEHEATYLLNDARKKTPRDPVIQLHLGELAINRNDFEYGVKILRSAQRDVVGMNYFIRFDAFAIKQSNKQLEDKLAERLRQARDEITCSIIALLGICLFRLQPNRPEIPSFMIQEGLVEHPNSTILLLCSGEVNSQVGDMVTALESYHLAHLNDIANPLPLINAARTYQQLGQTATAKKHFDAALHLDPTMSMSRVDLAQALLQCGEIQQALDMLEIALSLARQVSEIRDVLSAQFIAKIQLKLEQKGLYKPNNN